MTDDSHLLRRQVVLDELTSMRRLGRDRRDASTRLPVLSRTGPLARKAVPAAASVEPKAATRLPEEPE